MPNIILLVTHKLACGITDISRLTKLRGAVQLGHNSFRFATTAITACHPDATKRISVVKFELPQLCKLGIECSRAAAASGAKFVA